MKLSAMAGRYMNAADDKGSDLGGGAVDRGDGLDLDTTITKVEAEVKDIKVEAEDAAEVADAEAKVDKAEKTDERDEKGQFKKKDDDKVMIPKSRFDKAVDKERLRAETAERRASELEKQIRQVGHTEDMQAVEKEIETLEDKLEAARLDGNKDKARELAKELRLKERQVSTAESSRMSGEAKEQAREEMRLDLTIEKLETLHPILNEADESYDQDVVDMVLATQRDLIQRQRMAPSKALEEATKKVMSKITRAEPAKEDEPEKEKGGLKDAEGKSAGRKEAQVKKNLDTAAKQPASMKEAGIDSDKAGQNKELPSAEKLSFEEFSALPEATKAKMRGDFA